MKILAAVILISLAPGTARAACGTSSTQADLTMCAGAEAQSADAALNAVFQKLLAKISEAGQQHLRDAERAWLSYRDKQCAFDTLASVGGSLHPMLETECRQRLTQIQTAHLEAQLDCGEGDMSCGGQ